MKNTLLCTTALAMTGIAGAANAAEVSAGAVNMGFSGYYTTNIAITSVDTGASHAATDFDGLDIQTNAEIFFKPSVTLDNGIKIGVGKVGRHIHDDLAFSLRLGKLDVIRPQRPLEIVNKCIFVVFANSFFRNSLIGNHS